MAKRVEARREPRTPLSRERVLRAAIELVDEGGIESLSMRRLGQELGVEAMSLYNHVANKDDLLDAITNLVLSEIELPSQVGNWRTAVRQSAVSAHDLLRRHKWACSLALSPARNIPVRIRNMEWLLRTLREGGFSAELTYHAYHALDSHIWGFTLWELGHTITPADIGDLAAAFLRDFPTASYPYVHEHVEQHVSGFGRGESAFEFVLDLILDGLERALEAA
jgi:AcrR family transcriptional regulator